MHVRGRLAGRDCPIADVTPVTCHDRFPSLLRPLVTAEDLFTRRLGPVVVVMLMEVQLARDCLPDRGPQRVRRSSYLVGVRTPGSRTSPSCEGLRTRSTTSTTAAITVSTVTASAASSASITAADTAATAPPEPSSSSAQMIRQGGCAYGPAPARRLPGAVHLRFLLRSASDTRPR